MPTKFSAGPQALGYLYQARVALFLLCQAPDEAEARLEALDDIQIDGDLQGKTIELSQLKHHISRTANLTDASEDLWKSIRVWATHVADRRFSLSDARLFLITTATAPDGSVGSILRPDTKRSPIAAEQRLRTVAKTSTNEALAPAFATYLGLTDSERQALVSSVYVLDQQDDIVGYRDKIKMAIRPAVRREHLEHLLERVEGWWFDRVVRLLASASPDESIQAFEVNEKIAEVAQSFHQESLPIDFFDKSPDEAYIASSREKMFVKQIEVLGVQPRSVTKAILDYYRAFSQRSRWLKESLVNEQELASFENKLVDEWERYCDALRDEGVSSDEQSLMSFGRKVLRWAEQETTHLKIRPRVDADFVRRGSFHILADKTPEPSIYWHPEFMKMLADSIAKATKENIA